MHVDFVLNSPEYLFQFIVLMILKENSENSLSAHPDVFTVEPEKCRINRYGGVARFSLNFRPNKPEIFCQAELHGSLLWGEMEEYKVPYALAVHLMGK